jgi:hypothetical protein
MKKTIRRRTSIETENHEVTIIRANVTHKTHFCQHCSEDVSVFAPEHAAFMFRVQRHFIDRLLESDRIHRAGEAGLCANSLVGYFKLTSRDKQ